MKKITRAACLIGLALLWAQPVKAQDESHGQALDLSRPSKEKERAVDETQRFTGVIVLKPFGKNLEWPYLKSNNQEYRLETTSPRCQEQIAQCEKGDICTVKGEIVGESDPVLKAKSVTIQAYADKNLAEETENNTVTSVNGCKFVRDTFNPALGEAWRSPRGIVWGDFEVNADGSPVVLNSEEAIKFCAKKGTRLPSRADWNELIGCVGSFGEHPFPFRNLDFDKFLSLEKDLGLPLDAKIFRPRKPVEQRFRKVRWFASGDEGWEIDDNDRGFVRCVFDGKPHKDD